MVTEAMQPGQREISEGVHRSYEPGVLHFLDIFSDKWQVHSEWIRG